MSTPGRTELLEMCTTLSIECAVGENDACEMAEVVCEI